MKTNNAEFNTCMLSHLAWDVVAGTCGRQVPSSAVLHYPRVQFADP